jgi:hypothetical protein
MFDSQNSSPHFRWPQWYWKWEDRQSKSRSMTFFVLFGIHSLYCFSFALLAGSGLLSPEFIFGVPKAMLQPLCHVTGSDPGTWWVIKFILYYVGVVVLMASVLFKWRSRSGTTSGFNQAIIFALIPALVAITFNSPAMVASLPEKPTPFLLLSSGVYGETMELETDDAGPKERRIYVVGSVQTVNRSDGWYLVTSDGQIYSIVQTDTGVHFVNKITHRSFKPLNVALCVRILIAAGVIVVAAGVMYVGCKARDAINNQMKPYINALTNDDAKYPPRKDGTNVASSGGGTQCGFVSLLQPRTNESFVIQSTTNNTATEDVSTNNFRDSNGNLYAFRSWLFIFETNLFSSTGVALRIERSRDNVNWQLETQPIIYETWTSINPKGVPVAASTVVFMYGKSRSTNYSTISQSKTNTDLFTTDIEVPLRSVPFDDDGNMLSWRVTSD